MYSVGVAYFLWLISGCGAFGFHRFYLNKPATGILWLFTGGLSMIGSIYDLFTLGSQVREANMRLELRRALELRERRSIAPRLRYDPSAYQDFKKKESLERTILRVAKRNNGIATPSDVALEADTPIEDAKAALEKLVDRGFAELRVRKSGAIVYAFPEFIADNSPLEEF